MSATVPDPPVKEVADESIEGAALIADRHELTRSGCHGGREEVVKGGVERGGKGGNREQPGVDSPLLLDACQGHRRDAGCFGKRGTTEVELLAPCTDMGTQPTAGIDVGPVFFAGSSRHAR